MGSQPAKIEGKVSSKLQVTIPARVRDALGIHPGDTVRYELEDGSVRLRVVRPDIDAALATVWKEHDLTELLGDVGTDAVGYVRRQRGWDEVEVDDQP